MIATVTSNKQLKAEARRAYRTMWPSGHHRHKWKRGTKASLKEGKVYLWDNGFVMVFNEAGEQIREMQGWYVDVRRRILIQSHHTTAFFRCGDWQSSPRIPITQSDFASAKEDR